MSSYFINSGPDSDLYVVKVLSDAAGSPRIGPYQNGSDLYLFFLYYTAPARYVEAWKSSDSGQTWAVVDNANRPQVDTWYNCCQNGTTVCILHEDAFNNNLALTAFDMSTDSWGVPDTGGPASASPYYGMGGSVQLRSDGSLACVYHNWGARMQVSYVTWSAGVWGVPVTVMTDATHYIVLLDAILGAGDLLHVFGYQQPHMVMYHRSVASDDSLGTQQTIGSTLDAWSFSARAAYTSGDQIIIPWLKASDEKIYQTRGASVVNPVWTDTLVSATRAYLREEDALSAVESGSTLRLVWALDNAGSVDDIYSNTETAGAWGADEEIAEGEQPHPATVNGSCVLVHYWPDADVPGWYYTPLALVGARYRVLP